MSNPYFPAVPGEWQSDYRAYQRELAARISVIAAVALLVLVPLLVFIDIQVKDFSGTNLVRQNAAWRLPAFLLSVGVLFLHWFRPEGDWPRPVLLLLSLSLVGMLCGMFLMHYMTTDGQAVFIFVGLAIILLATAAMSVNGLRDLAFVYGLPAVATALYLWFGNVPPLDVEYLVYALMAVVIGAAISEVLYRNNILTFNARKQLEVSALTDMLTGLMNRRAMDQQLVAEKAKALRHGKRFAIIMADLDEFKAINDRYGHETGDQILKELAGRLSGAVRIEDRVARWGGEEFLILIPEGDEAGAQLIAERIREAIGNSPFQTTAVYLPCTISLGVAVFEGDEHLEQLVSRADAAMYRAKNNGRNRAVLADPASQSAA